MDERLKAEKISRFLKDAAMSEAVKSVLLAAFLKKNATTVPELAAERLAITLVQDAWRDLELYKSPSDGETSERTQEAL